MTPSLNLSPSLRSVGVSLVGAACFVAGAIVLGVHPNRSWREITGKSVHHAPTQTRLEGFEWGSGGGRQ